MSYVMELRELVGTRPLLLPGSVVLVINEDNKLLLQHRRDGSWGVPGGLMEVGESLEDTARREVKEETGLEVGELELLDVCSGPEYFLRLPNGDEIYSITAVYLTKQSKGSIIMDDMESIDLQYFDINDLPKGLNEANSKYIEVYLKKLQNGSC
ncbi:NUDIX hydrolase [Cytobacillus sp. FJAT-54145]|uniref:NUDIX hydrolase n=1 Tax=Cytobacillus spartinae TaxID=3299023 RepID=A0ABW6KA12_9BACI